MWRNVIRRILVRMRQEDKSLRRLDDTVLLALKTVGRDHESNADSFWELEKARKRPIAWSPRRNAALPKP